MPPETISNYTSPAMSMLGLKEKFSDATRALQEFSGDVSEWGTDYKGRVSAGRQLGGLGMPVGLYAISRATGVPIDLVWYAASSFFGSLFGGEVAESTADAPPVASDNDIGFGMQDLAQLETEKEAIESYSDWEYDAMDAINRAIQVYTLGKGGKALSSYTGLTMTPFEYGTAGLEEEFNLLDILPDIK